MISLVFVNQLVGHSNFFQKFWRTCPSEPRYLIPIELKNPNPAAPGNGGIGERMKPHAHATGNGMKPSIG